MSNQCRWLTHDLWVYPKYADWKDEPGVYVFAARNIHQQWVALYIGQAGQPSRPSRQPRAVG